MFFAERYSSAAPVAGAERASARSVTDIGVGSGAWFGSVFIIFVELFGDEETSTESPIEPLGSFFCVISLLQPQEIQSMANPSKYTRELFDSAGLTGKQVTKIITAAPTTIPATPANNVERRDDVF
jgi:hypothetical protein